MVRKSSAFAPKEIPVTAMSAILSTTNTRVLEGGSTFNVVKRAVPAGGKLSPEEIKRVKGLGCLQDKRYGDVFNLRG